MEESRFVYMLAPLFYCTSPEALSGSTRYKQLREWNMILAVTLSREVEERYRVCLEASDFRRADTFGELYRLVLSKQ